VEGDTQEVRSLRRVGVVGKTIVVAADQSAKHTLRWLCWHVLACRSHEPHEKNKPLSLSVAHGCTASGALSILCYHSALARVCARERALPTMQTPPANSKEVQKNTPAQKMGRGLYVLHTRATGKH